MSNERDLPEFVREALADEPGLDATPIARLPELLEPSAAPSGLARLMAAVDAPPLRYAPFYGRVGRLFDLPEAAVAELLARTAEPEAWRKMPLPGLSVIDVQAGPGAQGEARLVRFAPGMRFPKHRHPGPEAVLLLEGSYTDSSGCVYQSGDLHEMAPGSEHGFRVARDEPCIAASLQSGLEFTGLFMRLLAKIVGGG